MSNYGWERITITLPAAQVAPLKKVLRETLNELHADVRSESIRIFKEVLKTRSFKVYGKRLDEYAQDFWAKYREAEQTAAKNRSSSWGWGYSSYYVEKSHREREAAEREQLVFTLSMQVLRSIQSKAIERTDWQGNVIEAVAIHQPTVADVDKVAPRATNKTTLFANPGAPGAISFEGRTVIFDVSENNHAVEHAHEGVLSRVFFDFLSKVTWTRGTGGFGVGNDEYNRDSQDAGYGGNYITSIYGPLGEAEKERRDKQALLMAGIDPRTGKRF